MIAQLFLRVSEIISASAEPSGKDQEIAPDGS